MGRRMWWLTALQKVISDMKQLIKDPDLARLFENTFPNASALHALNKLEAY